MATHSCLLFFFVPEEIAAAFLPLQWVQDPLPAATGEGGVREGRRGTEEDEEKHEDEHWAVSWHEDGGAGLLIQLDKGNPISLIYHTISTQPPPPLAI
jgi:hypothetical protein